MVTARSVRIRRVASQLNIESRKSATGLSKDDMVAIVECLPTTVDKIIALEAWGEYRSHGSMSVSPFIEAQIGMTGHEKETD